MCLPLFRPLLLLPLLLAAASACATVTAIDDAGNTVSLAQPAKRIVSLAPHATELLFAAGAQDKIVAVSAFSDYPAAAKKLPSIGSISGVDIERIITLQPDLIVAWKGGNTDSQLTRLRQLGIPMFLSAPLDFETVASSLVRLSRLSGTTDVGHAAAKEFRQRWHQLRTTYAQRPTVDVFYQIWQNPLMTLNNTHLISKSIALCGGNNIFGTLTPLVPTVTTEAVLSANPEVILTTSDTPADALKSWQRFTTLRAVQHKQLHVVNADEISRPGPRILQAAAHLCTLLDAARVSQRP